MRPFDFYQPTTFEEAFELLNTPGVVVHLMAGGTDLIPQLRDGMVMPDVVVDVKGLPGLRDLRETDEGLLVGAALRMNELARSELVRGRWALLAQAAAAMGNEQVRNRATLGGNNCTASPAADTAPALLVLEARAVVRGPKGERHVPMTEFFEGPRRTALQAKELLAGFLIPESPSGAASTYQKLSRRKAGDLAIVGVAALAYPVEEGYAWRMALGAVAPTPLRVPEAERALTAAESEGDKGFPDDAAIDAATRCCFDVSAPIDDVRAGAEYRRHMVVRMGRRAIEEVAEQIRA
jgi:carbon-monoxide dehydrogenase medium subunit